MMVSLVLQLCMFLVIAMGKILCYDNCMMKNILKNKKFWKIICIGYKFSCFYGTDFFYWKVIIVRKLLL